jgi:hypothetical protein
MKLTMGTIYWQTFLHSLRSKLVSISKTAHLKGHFYNFTKVKALLVLEITIVPSGAMVYCPCECTGESQSNLSVLESLRTPDSSVLKIRGVDNPLQWDYTLRRKTRASWKCSPEVNECNIPWKTDSSEHEVNFETQPPISRLSSLPI